MKMRDLPMLDTDRENMRLEFGPEFDNMTIEEFRAACAKRMDELLDFVNELDGKR